MERTARTSEGSLSLLAQAAGSPLDLARKLTRLVRALARYGSGLDQRLALLVERGYIDRDRVPTLP